MNLTSAHLNYLHDTLFGPIAKSLDCQLVITPITPGAFQVRVLPPFPDDLHKAHSITITQPSKQTLTGTVVHTRNLENGELELQIDV
ncbi:hypothetical protein [Pseudomonas sp. SDO55104_S430]